MYNVTAAMSNLGADSTLPYIFLADFPLLISISWQLSIVSLVVLELSFFFFLEKMSLA